MDGSNVSTIGDDLPADTESSISKLEDIPQGGPFKIGLGKKLESRRSRVQRLPHVGGGNGRTFDLEDIASGSNGSHVTSTDRACRVTVTIIAAKDLKRSTIGPEARDPVFKVRVEETVRKSKDLKTGVNQVLMDLLAGPCLVWKHIMPTFCQHTTEDIV